MSFQDYSGIVINQNAAPAGPAQTTSATGAATLYQTFDLPSDYPRGPAQIVAPLTGAQFFVTIPSGLAAAASLTWELDYSYNNTWVSLASGTTTGAAHDGQTWFNVFFPRAVDVSAVWQRQFRLLLTSTSDLDFNYSSPNSLTISGAAYRNGVALGAGVSLMFRVLAGVADSGTDFLGNVYRSVALPSSADNVSPVVPTGEFTYWMSKPNPTRFGVENLYFTMNDGPVVVDHVTLDPLTPGVYFHIYYSSDPSGPGDDNASWENLMWTPVYRTFQALRQGTYALPSPISARYIKIEFSGLQARSYTPGDFQKFAQYRKYPKWVLDYFLSRFAALDHNLLSSGVDVTYDAIDLAFSYYSADLVEAPDVPALARATSQASPFLPTSLQNQVDAKTLAGINLAFQPYTTPPAIQGTPRSVIGRYASSISTSNYPTEVINGALADTSVVSSTNREALLLEKAFPTMFFFVPSRHGYRTAQAIFESNVGYFAGVNLVAFHRDEYTYVADQAQYNESFFDTANAAYNDFLGA